MKADPFEIGLALLLSLFLLVLGVTAVVEEVQDGRTERACLTAGNTPEDCR